jgi:hypothetical protein
MEGGEVLLTRSENISMKSFLDWIRGKSQVKCEEYEGTNSVVHTVEKHPERTFKVAWPGKKSSGVSAEEVIRFIREELPSHYDYYVKIKTYVDRHKIPQAEIEIQGTIGIRGRPGRYNPFDTRFFIKTEGKQRRSTDEL